jgi:hypothetical protein
VLRGAGGDIDLGQVTRYASQNAWAKVVIGPSVEKRALHHERATKVGAE